MYKDQVSGLRRRCSVASAGGERLRGAPPEGPCGVCNALMELQPLEGFICTVQQCVDQTLLAQMRRLEALQERWWLFVSHSPLWCGGGGDGLLRLVCEAA